MDRLIQKEYLLAAYHKARQSKDSSTQNGAIMVSRGIIGSGYNGLPVELLDKPERHERPAKYRYYQHAERAAIYDAIRRGQSVSGATLVACWAACCNCALAMIGCGIRTLITHKQAYDRTPDSWKGEVEAGLEMLREAGIAIVMYDGSVGLNIDVRHSGKIWRP